MGKFFKWLFFIVFLTTLVSSILMFWNEGFSYPIVGPMMFISAVGLLVTFATFLGPVLKQLRRDPDHVPRAEEKVLRGGSVE